MSITAHNLTKAYPTEKGIRHAADNINFTLNQGDYISIMGRSGSGKTTFLNLLAGFLSPTSGEITVDDENIANWDDYQLSQYRNQAIGFIPQGLRVISGLTVLDNVRLPYYLHKNEGISEQRAIDLLLRVGIAHLANQYPKHLSGGELKRISIARALINQPKYLLADEPTADLDEETSDEIMQIFSSIADDGVGILLVTHDRKIANHATSHLTMTEGKLTSNQASDIKQVRESVWETLI